MQLFGCPRSQKSWENNYILWQQNQNQRRLQPKKWSAPWIRTLQKSCPSFFGLAMDWHNRNKKMSQLHKIVFFTVLFIILHFLQGPKKFFGGKYIIWHTCLAYNFDKKRIWIPVNPLEKVNIYKYIITPQLYYFDS